MKETNRDLMEKYFRAYVKEKWGIDSDEEHERLFAGVMGFIWSNLFGEPYQPIFFDSIEEEPRKWWQIWRKK